MKILPPQAGYSELTLASESSKLAHAIAVGLLEMLTLKLSPPPKF